ncbi:MAG: hypothetical protein GEU75_03790 [Dehalococcoidia bacterium]|nr:hypothetical protein [Dehalococcoidia bacterium]
MRFARRLLSLVAPLAAMAVLACGGGSDGGGDLRVEVREWSVVPARDEGSSGPFTIELVNQGTRPHQLVIVKSDLPPGLLPTAGARVDETLVIVAGRIEPIAAGARETRTMELTAGKYVLICNVVEQPAGGPVQGHYQNGMAATFLIDQ